MSLELNPQPETEVITQGEAEVNTAMTEALKEAGIPLPKTPDRVFNWLKGRGWKTISEIKTALNLPDSINPNQLMANMTKRGDLKARSTTRFGRKTKEYATAVEKRGDGKPPRKGAVVNVLKPVSMPPPAPTPAKPEFSAPTRSVAFGKFDIEQLTLGEARTLYQHLHKMFGTD